MNSTKAGRFFLLISIFVLFTVCSSDEGQAGDSGGVCADGDTASVGAASSLPDKFAVIRVEPSLNTNSNTQSTLDLYAVTIATEFTSGFPRARVMESSEIIKYMEYVQLLQALGNDNWTDNAVSVLNTWKDADISIALKLDGDPAGVMTLTMVAVDCQHSKTLSTATYTGTASAINDQLATLCATMMEQVKNARVGIGVNPERSAIDFDQVGDRQRVINVQLLNLKNLPVDGAVVRFELGDPASGTLSASQATVSGGDVATTFTMTSRKANFLTCSYTNGDIYAEAQAYLIPRCGWVIFIEGTKTFNTTQDPNALCGTGGWITINGTSTESGAVPLIIADDGSGQAGGYGWNSETHSSVVTARVVLFSGMDPIQNTISQSGTARGTWFLDCSLSGDTLTINSAFSFGLYGQPGAAGSFTTLSTFQNASIQLVSGATTTVNGSMALIGGTDTNAVGYSYTLTMKRAKQ